jgi:hypothetical protein
MLKTSIPFSFHSKILKFQNLENSSSHPVLPHSCHNILNSDNFAMEGDCKDHHIKPKPYDEVPDINKLFATLSEQMIVHTTRMHEKLSTDFTRVAQAHENFKQEVRDELDEIHYLISLQSQNPSSFSRPLETSASSTVPSSSAASTVHSSPALVPQQNVPVSGSNSGSMSGQDLQNQMMMMLTESFSKLSSVLIDKSAETKSD